MATAIPLPARRDAPGARDAFTLSMLVLAGTGLAVLVGLWIVAQALTRDSVGVATELRATAAAIDEHADAMADHGTRLLNAARAGSGADREHWMADAQHMIADADSLHALAARLRTTAGRLGDRPAEHANASSSRLDGWAATLRADGNAAVEHGRAMQEHATFMAELARQPGSAVTVADAELMASDSARIADAGERVLRVVVSLESLADQLRGMLRP